MDRGHLVHWKRNTALAIAAMAVFVAPSSATAAMTEPQHVALASVYAQRADLQRFFDATTWKALGFAQTGTLADLEEWARRYGYKEHPAELVSFSPATPVPGTESGRAALASVYAQRADLQRFFDATTWKALGFAQTGTLADLEEWARRYGYKEHPAELAAYAPLLTQVPGAVPARDTTVIARPPALVPVEGVPKPVSVDGAVFDLTTITAQKVLVLDPVSRRVILAKGEREPHVAASLTKLMTALVAKERGVSFSSAATLTAADDVGGAKLRVTDGTVLTVGELFYTMLVGSANNAAHALARAASPDGSVPTFVAAMNAKAVQLGLADTRFVDPAGIEVPNTTTAQDMAALFLAAQEQYDIRRATSTAKYTLVADGTTRTIENTNGLLTDPDNGLYVLGGKTGYLIESQWNLAVRLSDAARAKPELLVVVLGSNSRPDSFVDVERIARWVWATHRWER